MFLYFIEQLAVFVNPLRSTEVTERLWINELMEQGALKYEYEIRNI